MVSIPLNLASVMNPLCTQPFRSHCRKMELRRQLCWVWDIYEISSRFASYESRGKSDGCHFNIIF
ncbi:hypothetical protein Syun_014878 [Stephania yunnanensis]|uniref:Uncharacterized protein n=1 Tax=Stephania yunnanensis TaxID=152371 RepID=A0AAP0P8X4_9MAGN